MRFNKLHRWDISPGKAIQLQKQLKDRIAVIDDFEAIRTVAGADIAFTKGEDLGFAGVIVYKYPELKELERVSASAPLNFPYIPGLLSFREAPLLLKAFSRLKERPDAVLFDGQGIAHPRRIGIASHMGLWLDIPAIGCAKSRLVGEYSEPGRMAGSCSALYDGPEKIGAVVRTRTDTRPIFVSPGHKISIESAVEIVLNCTDGYRIPKPTREADRYVKLITEVVKNGTNILLPK